MKGEVASHDGLVIRKDVGVGVETEALQEFRRAFDVGEQESECFRAKSLRRRPNCCGGSTSGQSRATQISAHSIVAAGKRREWSVLGFLVNVPAIWKFTTKSTNIMDLVVFIPPNPTPAGGNVSRRLVVSAIVLALASSAVFATAAGAAAARRGHKPAGEVLSVKTDTTTNVAVTLDGAGANSIEPFFEPVFYDYEQKNPKTTINYNPAGSSVGVSDIQQETVNFGDSEIPMNEIQLDQARDPSILQVPVDLGGVAISVNLPGLKKRLDLDGPTLAGIFEGTITNWDSPQLASVTGISNLPNLPIIPVHRADSSGPSYDLDEYLFKTAPAWAAAIKTTTPSRAWPLPKVGVGEQLNTGVATYIRQTAGSIGYLEYAYALESGFSCAAIKNRAGDFVTPSEKSIAAAGAHNGRLSPFNSSIIYEPGAATYPIANFSWTLILREQSSAATGIALGKLLYYVVNQGQKLAGKLGYAPLPANVTTIAIRTLERLEGPSGRPLFSS